MILSILHNDTETSQRVARAHQYLCQMLSREQQRADFDVNGLVDIMDVMAMTAARNRVRPAAND